MFENLTSKLEGIFNKLKKAPSLNEGQIETGLKEIRQALLAADVALPVVKKLIPKWLKFFIMRWGRFLGESKK